MFLNNSHFNDHFAWLNTFPKFHKTCIKVAFLVSIHVLCFSTPITVYARLKVTALVSAVLRSGPQPADLDEFTISRSTSMRRRGAHRQEAAERIKEEFVPPKHATLHWDGKVIKVRKVILLVI